MADLHFLERILLPIDSILTTLNSVLEALSLCFKKYSINTGNIPNTPTFTSPTCHDWTKTLAGRQDQVIAYKNNVQVLLKKCGSTTALLNGLLQLKSQNIFQEQSNYVLDLSTSTVVITVIFLIYLSFTAVAVSCIALTSMLTRWNVDPHFFQTIMGMPFFKIEEISDQLFVSPQIWIYLAISLPLTGVTIAYWQLSVRRKRLERRRKLSVSSKGYA